MSNSLQTHGSKHTRLPCPSLSPGVCSNSCQWKPPNHLILCCPLPLLPSIFPSIRIFEWVSSSHQVLKHGALASVSVLPMSIQGWFLLGLIGLISLQSKGLSRVFSSTTLEKHQFFGAQPSLWLVQLSHLYMTTGKNHSFGYTELCQQRDVSAF